MPWTKARSIKLRLTRAQLPDLELAEPGTKGRPQEEIARMVQAATVLVIVE